MYILIYIHIIFNVSTIKSRRYKKNNKKSTRQIGKLLNENPKTNELNHFIETEILKLKNLNSQLNESGKHLLSKQLEHLESLKSKIGGDVSISSPPLKEDKEIKEGKEGKEGIVKTKIKSWYNKLKDLLEEFNIKKMKEHVNKEITELKNINIKSLTDEDIKLLNTQLERLEELSDEIKIKLADYYRTTGINPFRR